MVTEDTNQVCVTINLHIFSDYNGCCLLGYNLCSKIHSVSRMKLLRANSHTNKSYSVERNLQAGLIPVSIKEPGVFHLGVVYIL